MTADPERLALLERGHVEAEQTLADIKAQWAREDEVREAGRARILELHAEGARVRDEMRVELGGKSLLPKEAGKSAA